MPLVKTPVFIKSWEKEMYESKLEAKDAVIKDKEEEIERLKEELRSGRSSTCEYVYASERKHRVA